MAHSFRFPNCSTCIPLAVHGCLCILRGKPASPPEWKRMCINSQQGSCSTQHQNDQQKKEQPKRSQCIIVFSRSSNSSHCESLRLLIWQVQSSISPLISSVTLTVPCFYICIQAHRWKEHLFSYSTKEKEMITLSLLPEANASSVGLQEEGWRELGMYFL